MSTEFDTIKSRFGIVGNDKALKRAVERAVLVAPTELPVLITGESGVGKDNFSKIIHTNSRRKNGNIVSINCGAIPAGTINAELFGNEKGAFTGAVGERKGLFEVANNGTIFLDEVGDIPLDTQVMLLRVLENGEYYRVGSSEIRKTNVRVVAATNVDLADRIAKGKFREDLYYRLCAVQIHLPALRERRDDIYPLFLKFSNDFSQQNQIPAIALTPDAVEVLKNYSWPGNIRQLKQVASVIALSEQSRTINAEVVREHLKGLTNAILPVRYRHPDADTPQYQIDELKKEIASMKHDVAILKEFLAQLIQNRSSSESHSQLHGSESEYLITQTSAQEVDLDEASYEEQDTVLVDDDDVVETQAVSEVAGTSAQAATVRQLKREEEKRKIQEALNQCGGNRKQAAVLLGVSDRTIYRKIVEYGIQKQ